MFKKIVLYFVFSQLFCFFGYAQNLFLEGKISDTNGRAISLATLQLKNSQNGVLVTYGFTNDLGNYKFLVKAKTEGKFWLIVSSLGYKRDTLDISNLDESSRINNFRLQIDENQLKEVVIKGSKPIVQEINDTTNYNVKAFTSPEDRNLESVIKKMPGMEVSSDGTIYFKKKKISKVLLESDDLTGENYKPLTQNLNPNLVSEVQAIENWVEDDLLKGIINSDDIVLNLILKDKRKQKIIGSADIDYGINDRRDLSLNLITFVGKTKAFGYIRSNNIGSSQENIFQLSGLNRKLNADSKLIDHKILTNNPFDGETMALNNSLSSSLNAITRFSPAFKISTSINGLRNKLYGNNLNTNIFYEPLNVITVNQLDQFSNNQLYQADLNSDYLVAKNARFTTKLSYKFRPQLFNSLTFSSYNNNISDEVIQNQKDRLKNYSVDLKYTLKTKTSAAIILSAKLAQDDINQNYNLVADFYNRIPIFYGATSLLQTADVSNKLFKFDAQALKKINQNYLYLNLGGEYNSLVINSNLYNNATNNAISDFLNNSSFKNHKAYVAGKYSYNIKGTAFYTLLKLSLVNQQTLSGDSSFLVFEPELGLSKKIGEMQSLKFNYSYKNVYTNPINYYNKLVLTDVRELNAGLSDLYNYGAHNFQLSYSNNELASNYFSFNANMGLQHSEGSILTNNFFESTMYYNKLIPYKSNSSLNAGMSVQKFFPAIASQISLNYSPSLSKYFGQTGNVIDGYKAFTQILSTKVGTGFKLPVNFSLEFQYQNNATFLDKYKINSQDVYKYTIQSRYNISKNLFNLIDFNWYRMTNQNYKLLNLQLQYSPSKGIFKYAIFGKNLFNVSSINNTYVDNVGEFKSDASILGRYFLGSISISIK